MSGKADFTVDEWDLLRSSPLMASMLVVAASPSGPIGLVQESSAAAKTILQTVGSAETPLLKALSEDVTQTMAVPKPPPGATPGQVQEAAAEILRRTSALLTTKATRPYTQARFEPGDFLVFGSETKGLGRDFIARHREQTYTIPIFEPGVRSLNLSNAVSIAVYEALRQTGAI